MIPKKDNRVFQSYGLAESAKTYDQKPFKDFIKEIVENEYVTFRVRVHANHSYSGFGKAFEAKFKYDKKSEMLIKV
jgi:hypothetical protein